jgi:hypothetical protein
LQKKRDGRKRDHSAEQQKAHLHVQLHDGNMLFGKEWLQRNKKVQHVIVFLVSEMTIDGADLLNHRVDGRGMKARAI